MTGADHLALRAALDGCGFDPTRWPQTLEEIRCALDARLFGFIRIHRDDCPQLLGTPHLVEQHLQRYFADEWHGRDPRAAQLTSATPMRLTTDADVLEPEVLRDHDFYRDFAAAEDVPHSVFWRIDDTPRSYVFTALFGRAHGPAGATELALLRKLQHRATAAALLSNRLQNSRDGGVLEGLAATGVAAVALGWRGEIVDTTPEGQSLVDRHLRVHEGRLTSADPVAARAFARLAAALGTRPGQVNLEAFMISRPGRHALLCLPILNAGAGLDIFRDVRAVLIFRDLDGARATNPSVLRSMFGLTVAEAEVANLVASGASLEAISATRQVELSTTRAILRAVFKKTGVHRQSELSALLGRLA
jgi:DNA-binding CsgD family transcriptional regulator